MSLCSLPLSRLVNLLGLFFVTLRERSCTFQCLLLLQGLVDFSSSAHLGSSVASWSKWCCFILGLACPFVGWGEQSGKTSPALPFFGVFIIIFFLERTKTENLFHIFGDTEHESNVR